MKLKYFKVIVVFLVASATTGYSYRFDKRDRLNDFDDLFQLKKHRQRVELFGSRSDPGPLRNKRQVQSFDYLNQENLEPVKNYYKNPMEPLDRIRRSIQELEQDFNLFEYQQFLSLITKKGKRNRRDTEYFLQGAEVYNNQLNERVDNEVIEYVRNRRNLEDFEDTFTQNQILKKANEFDDFIGLTEEVLLADTLENEQEQRQQLIDVVLQNEIDNLVRQRIYLEEAASLKPKPLVQILEKPNLVQNSRHSEYVTNWENEIEKENENEGVVRRRRCGRFNSPSAGFNLIAPDTPMGK